MSRVTFVAGKLGTWRIESIAAICGEGVGPAERLERIEAPQFLSPPEGGWRLCGVRSNERYTEKSERERLIAIQPPLDRMESVCASLIPIKKSEAWWALAQDERRRLFEERSKHLSIGIEYLPAVARRLYHSRDLGEAFDFLTWFEFAEKDASAFDELLRRLRDTEEWSYVEREVEIRLRRDRARD
jgi:hypothetical protein